MVAFASGQLRDSPLPDDFAFPDTPYPAGSKQMHARNLIGPHGQLNVTPFAIPIADILDIADAKKHFFIWGWIDYDDVFPGTKRHRTEFCYGLRVLLDPRNPTNANAVSMSMYHRHNGTDADCMHKPAPYKRT
jgi:hypothetical protein